MAGMKNSNKLIHIDRTDVTGLFGGGGAFKKDYQPIVSATPVCGLTAGGVVCVGVSIAETPIITTNLENFVMTGAWPEACFFSVHAADGAPISVFSLPFVGPANIVEKPLICSSSLNPGTYYICGRYNNGMYVIYIDYTGTVLWSSYYNAGNDIIPYAIVESPYTGTGIDVVVVGRYDDNTVAADGFFLGLKSGGGVITFNTIGDPAGTVDPNQYFRCITVAASTTGGSDGFVIGGITDPIKNPGHTWVLKLDEKGNTILWNTIISGHNDRNSLDAKAVVERLSAANGYEYYVLTQGSTFVNSAMVVYKLDKNGNPSAASNNDFMYTSSTSTAFNPINITYINSGSSSLGFQAYGGIAGSGAQLTEAYFNGETGCNQSLTNIALTEQGPKNMTTPGINLSNSFSPCADLALNFTAPLYNVNTICIANSIASGSNARTSGATGIAELQAQEQVYAYPNPTSGKLSFELTSDAVISVYSVMGTEVLHTPAHAGSNTIDLSSQSSGVYFVKISHDAQTQTIRVIKN